MYLFFSFPHPTLRRRHLPSFEALEPRRLYSTYDILGVQSASLDQPQIHSIFRASPTGNPFGGTSATTGYDVKAFLDTGASGILLSQETADALGLTRATSGGQNITFTDIGVAGGEAFDVSTPVYGALAPVRSVFDGDQPVEAFNQPFGPVRTQINQTPADFLVGPLDIIGMPALQGKVVVMDPTPLDQTDPSLVDSMKTYVYSPGTPYSAANKTTDPGIPAVNRHVKLSYGNFAKYTHVTPAGAQGPTLAGNPFIGPNPVRDAGVVDNTPAVHLTEGGASVDGSFLLDTGAAASFLSRNIAQKLGVRYRAGTYGTDTPILEDLAGNALPNQFTIPIGGIGGSITAAGFRADSLSLPTTEGEAIRFLNAPILVLDVTVQDPVTAKKITLDGDLGMNYLVSSVDVNGSSLGNGAPGAFDWITFDQPRALLGLNLPDAGPVTPPTTADINGAVYNDLNANGVHDSGEPGIAGRTVYLDANGSGGFDAGEKTAITANNGSYSFSALNAGPTYHVRQIVPAGSKSFAAGGGVYNLTPVAGQTLSGKDFGTFQTATLKGTAFYDVNANGLRDTGDTALAGWSVWLDLNGNGTKDLTDKTALTDSAGNYTFSGLDPKTYTARVVVQTGYRQSAPAGKPITATLTSGQTLSGQNFGLTKRASVSGVVFNDTSRNGVKENAEAGLAGWKVYIDANNNSKWDSTERFILSSATGAWSFGDLLSSKNYLIRVEQQTSWIRTAPSIGSFSITPTSGQTLTGKNFGERK